MSDYNTMTIEELEAEASAVEAALRYKRAKASMIQLAKEFGPPGANIVVGGELVQGVMTPTMAAVLDLRARLTAMGDNLTDEAVERISAEWRADWPGYSEATA
jgi:hypothetical protein